MRNIKRYWQDRTVPPCEIFLSHHSVSHRYPSARPLPIVRLFLLSVSHPGFWAWIIVNLLLSPVTIDKHSWSEWCEDVKGGRWSESSDLLTLLLSLHTVTEQQVLLSSVYSLVSTQTNMKGGASYSLMVTKSAKKNEKDTADIVNFQVQIALLNHRTRLAFENRSMNYNFFLDWNFPLTLFYINKLEFLYRIVKLSRERFSI